MSKIRRIASGSHDLGLVVANHGKAVNIPDHPLFLRKIPNFFRYVADGQAYELRSKHWRNGFMRHRLFSGMKNRRLITILPKVLITDTSCTQIFILAVVFFVITGTELPCLGLQNIVNAATLDRQEDFTSDTQTVYSWEGGNKVSYPVPIMRKQTNCSSIFTRDDGITGSRKDIRIVPMPVLQVGRTAVTKACILGIYGVCLNSLSDSRDQGRDSLTLPDRTRTRRPSCTHQLSPGNRDTISGGKLVLKLLPNTVSSWTKSFKPQKSHRYRHLANGGQEARNWIHFRMWLALKFRLKTSRGFGYSCEVKGISLPVYTAQRWSKVRKLQEQRKVSLSFAIFGEEVK